MLMEKVKTACLNLDVVSQNTLESSDDIYHGTEEQKQAVIGLKQVMGELVDDLNASADETVLEIGKIANVVDANVEISQVIGSFFASRRRRRASQVNLFL